MDKEKLDEFPFFTGKMLKAFLGKKNPSTTITRWKNKIKTITKGKYTTHENPLIYATTIITPSYCSFRSALHHYQLTNQIPLKVQVATKKRKKDTEEIQFIQIKHLFGYKKTKIENFDLFIAEEEKLLLDCLQHPHAGVSPSELNQLIKNKLNTKKIIQHLKKINNLTLTKKTGYLLDKTNPEIYNAFKNQINKNKNYAPLNPLLPKTKKTNKKWRLNINEEIDI